MGGAAVIIDPITGQSLGVKSISGLQFNQKAFAPKSPMILNQEIKGDIDDFEDQFFE
jgi:hypothetical protein